MNPVVVPSPDEAVSDFHHTGGRLHLISEFGRDPLGGRRDLQQFRLEAFTEGSHHLSQYITKLKIMTVLFSNSPCYILLTSRKDLQAL